MKAFHFRLQTSLDIAERQEQIAREELMARIQERDKLKVQLENAKRRLKGMEQSIRDSVQENMPLERVLIIVNYIPVMREVIDNIANELESAEQEVEKARQILLGRVKETRTLNKLREKEWLLYLEECNREEQKLIDEIAITRYSRQKS
jgi:flagellar FliJ protein